jgi:hypothetical protein
LNGTNPCAGAAPTATPQATPVRGFALGGQVMNRPDNLPVMQQAGMTWVKVQLRYSPGANVESTVRDFEAYKGFKLLISLVGHKEDIANGGPAYFQEFANFAAQLAFVADAIEIWNEPNILHEWPEGQISPQMYTQLLQASYTAIKSRNQTTIVISGGPSPTGVHDGTTVWSDDRFIQGMMAAGARNYMDCIGVHFNAGATPPNETTDHPADRDGQNHYSWYFMPMLNLYWDTFNPPGTTREIPLCFTEIGFLTDEGFSPVLAQTEARDFGWAQGTTVFNQAVWLSDALQRACLSGKVKLFIVWNVDFTEIWGGRDPQGGYAIMRPNGSCPACNSLNEAMINLRVANCV